MDVKVVHFLVEPVIDARRHGPVVPAFPDGRVQRLECIRFIIKAVVVLEGIPDGARPAVIIMIIIEKSGRHRMARAVVEPRAVRLVLGIEVHMRKSPVPAASHRRGKLCLHDLDVGAVHVFLMVDGIAHLHDVDQVLTAVLEPGHLALEISQFPFI